MALDKIKILQSGDKYGNDMIVKMSFPGRTRNSWACH